jgi:hypothetical protein
MTTALSKSLLRYTHLPALLHILRTRRITLLDPDTWDDRNDARYMELYKEKRGLQTLVALCFSQVPESYHHWRVFAHGSAGVCIYFHRSALIDHMSTAGVQSREIEYLTLKRARSSILRVDDLPYMKRLGYRPEGEFRFVYESATDTRPVYDVPITVCSIEKISLSPWLPNALKASVKEAITSVDGFEELKMSRSTLISNSEWQELGANAT